MDDTQKNSWLDAIFKDRRLTDSEVLDLLQAYKSRAMAVAEWRVERASDCASTEINVD